MPNVQWKTPDDEQRNCPKHVSVSRQKQIWKISASVGFIKKKIVVVVVVVVVIVVVPTTIIILQPILPGANVFEIYRFK